jgi:Phosphotransferase enzyme family
LERARRALFDERRIRALTPADRTLLCNAFEALVADLERHAFKEQALHGEPHDTNYLITSDGLRWIDLEAACRGPQEWDLAFLSADACTQFPDIDHELLRLQPPSANGEVSTQLTRAGHGVGRFACLSGGPRVVADFVAAPDEYEKWSACRRCPRCTEARAASLAAPTWTDVASAPTNTEQQGSADSRELGLPFPVRPGPK